jgi:TatD DNase family protein
MLIDAHAHLTHEAFADDVHAVLERARSAGIQAIVNICTHPEEVKKGLVLSQQFPWVYTVAATTPHDVEKEGETFFSQMEDAAKSGVLVAVGETGLDYHYYPGSKDIQKDFLRRYLKLATTYDLPVVIHCRDAFADLFQILDEKYVGRPGVLHCFTGNFEEAQQVIARGWYISMSGIVTFKKSNDLHEVAKTSPLDRLLIETDAPYLAPTPHRSKRNEPAYLVETAKFIAELRGISLDALAAATVRNARTLFKLNSTYS